MADHLEGKRLDAAARSPLAAVARDDQPMARDEHGGADPAEDDERLLAIEEIGLDNRRHAARVLIGAPERSVRRRCVLPGSTGRPVWQRFGLLTTIGSPGTSLAPKDTAWD